MLTVQNLDRNEMFKKKPKQTCIKLNYKHLSKYQ